jgi:NAD(P)-dependent dehydrogenase (short-subunit alcohol dehydrogenase family)
MGESHARLFAEEGAAVALSDVRHDLGERAAATLVREGFRAVYVGLDVTSSAAWVRAIAFVEQEFGALDVLVNNAGVVATPDAAAETEEGWARVVAVNQTGVFLGTHHAVPALRRAGGGAIVNVASNLGLVGDAGYFAYQASKGAVIQMTRAAAIAYVGDGIRVNSVCPGLVLTPMADEEGPESNAKFIAATPMGRAGQPLEVSLAILFLASPEASFITGAHLVVDGGYSAQ